jgi:hypothetical protein
MSPTNKFEALFREFVSDFGGEVIPEGNAESADFYFAERRVVAELKSLVKDQTDSANDKVAEIVLNWVKKNKRMNPGSQVGDKWIYELKEQPPEIRLPWVEILRAPIDDLIRKANSQIRETKSRFGYRDAIGLVFIFNEGNLLHSSPTDFARILGTVVQKRKPDGTLKYDEIKGVVFFSYLTVRTKDDNSSFWIPIQVKTSASEDLSAMEHFQIELRSAWYSFLERKYGVTIRQHDRDSA